MEIYLYLNKANVDTHIALINQRLGYPNEATKTYTYCAALKHVNEDKWILIKDSQTEQDYAGGATVVDSMSLDLTKYSNAA